MSFRARLTLFFVLIVIVPMLSVAIVLFRLISDNETGKADSSLAAHQVAARNLYRQATARNERAVAVGGLPKPAHAADVDAGDAHERAVTFAADGFGRPRGHDVLVGVLEANNARTGNVRRAYLIAAGILAGFLVLAITFALAVSRSL